MRLIVTTSLAASLALSAVSLAAQTPKPTRTKPPKAKFDTASVAKFFQTETPIAVTLTTNVDRIRGDKDPATAPWRWASLSLSPVAPDTGRVTVPVRVKTRGIWRLKTCQFPPVRLNFSGAAAKHTVFHGLDKPKLVNHCRDDDTYEQYVLQEFQLYRIYHLLTPASHAVRLLRMSYADSASGKVLTTRYAFIEEEPEALAARLGAMRTKVKGAGPGDLEPSQSVLVGLFQYLIGNTDFALSALHNAELMQMRNGDYVPVVYDFDFAGAVNARYATPDPRLHLRTVRQRLYRGYCEPNDAYPKAFALFNAKKDSIYGLYRDPLGKLLRPGIVDETLQYFDEFYKTINDPRAAKNDIIDACLGRR